MEVAEKNGWVIQNKKTSWVKKMKSRNKKNWTKTGTQIAKNSVS